MRRVVPSRGFTLIETLAVVVIIGVLLGIMLPVLGRARGTARQVVCLTRVQQIHTALTLYEDAAKGCIPREATMGTTPQDYRARIPWNVALRPYLDERASPLVDLDDMFTNAPYYRCPSHRPGPHNIHYVANGFAFRAPGVPDERGAGDPDFRRGPSPAYLIPRPASMLYLTDLSDDPGDLMFAVWRRLGDTDISIGQCYDAWLPLHVTPGSGDFRIGPRCHTTGATALYLDGHACQQSATYFLDVDSWDDGWYTRN